MKGKNTIFTGWYSWAVAVLLGIVLLGTVFLISANSDMMTAESHLSDTANYVTKQCTTYSSLNLASEAKSLIRIVSAAQQAARNIQYDALRQRAPRRAKVEVDGKER